ncbi:Excitatory amino acid transporter 1 [Sarcoptes scabiei]|uniref:Amino acid transporter n=1 Tax=Sarcoptes scabiei TaxID=52283 RepID=A0A834VDW4_SARSC|nr:Excitatory amino acid transporter 1 [Sarcoptes scabiei]
MISLGIFLKQTKILIATKPKKNCSVKAIIKLIQSITFFCNLFKFFFLQNYFLCFLNCDKIFPPFENRSVFPDNPIKPFFMRSYEQTEFVWPDNLDEILQEDFVPKNRIKTLYGFDPNMLGICILSMAFGFILSRLPPYKTEFVRSLLLEFDQVVKYVLDILIRVMPYGMFCWMFTESLKIKSLNEIIGQIFYFYFIAICLFLTIWFIFYPLVFFVIVRKNPFRLHRAILPAVIVAGASSSSAIALPFTMECMEDDYGLSLIISKMVLPLGMTLNMNGSAMYYPMVGVFISQIKQVPQNFLSLTVLCVFALVMSMGFPGVPAGGTTLITHLAFASILGIDNPQDMIIMVLTLDWIMERFRTITNIMGDCFVAKCVEKLAAIDEKTTPPKPNNQNIEIKEIVQSD